MKERKWEQKPQNEAAAAKLAAKLNIAPITARILIARGYDTAEKVAAFLSCSETLIGDPFLLSDMKKAVERIKSAAASGEKITIFGDYDVDGITSTVTLYKHLKRMGCSAEYYIPDRTEEGYGINSAALDAIAASGCKLLITVDCGITAIDEVKHAKTLGMDVVITDHHECKEEIPDCAAVVNPKRQDCAYPFKELAGVGVVFKLISALSPEINALSEYGELIALGTVADVMPLVGENRCIVAEGLKQINETSNAGIKALIEKSSVGEKRITAGTIGFSLAPRINAAGRIGCARRAAELLTETDKQKATEIAEDLCEINRRRQDEENGILKEALEQISDDADFKNKKIIVLSKENWHNGVIGIVASRISERYFLPAILISFDGEIGKGSGRSIKKFNLYEALESVSDTLIKFGGHALAAGLSVTREKLPDFERKLQAYAEANLNSDDLLPIMSIDCELETAEIGIKTVEDIHFLEPYGMGNPIPNFLISGAKILELIPLSGGKHTKLVLKKEYVTFSAVCFNREYSKFEFPMGSMIDLVVNLDISVFRGEQNLQVSVRDIKENNKYNSESERKFWNFIEGKTLSAEEAEEIIPSREEFIKVYKFLCDNAPITGETFLSLFYKCRKSEMREFNFGKFMLAVKVFEEAKLIAVSGDYSEKTIKTVATTEKKNLDECESLIKLKKIRAGRV